MTSGSASGHQVHRISWPLHGEDLPPTGSGRTGQECHGSLSWKPRPQLKRSQMKPLLSTVCLTLGQREP